MSNVRAPRRTHEKSKTGCSICRRRKIKCDEGRPSCRNCAKYGAQCVYPLRIHHRLITSPVESGGLHDKSSRVDFELLHHFTISTSFTLSPDPVVRTFWRINAPQIAFGNELVFRGILSLSAMHLAQCKEDRQDHLLTQAYNHHQKASTALETLSTSQPAADSCVSLYVYAVLQFILILAKPKDPGSLLLVTDDVVPDWLQLLREQRRILKSQATATQSSQLSPICHVGIQMDTSWMSKYPDAYESMQGIERTLAARHKDDPRTVAFLGQAFYELRRSFGFTYRDSARYTDEFQGVLTWLSYVSDEYFKSLQAKDQDALCILAFFCVLLKRLEHNWWVEKWAFSLLEEIYAHLDQDRVLLIRWPMEEVGWVG